MGDAAVAPRPKLPKKTEGRDPGLAGDREIPPLLFHHGPPSRSGPVSRSFQMKRIIVAAVLALTIVSGVVGCGGGSATTGPISTKPK